ncbi:hypothetical protein BC830DRAFT_726444 [Chytriomyces sp. MP71]|nr:hypothetical protein BC830DRAFT_726444 [Chytriomyces sp. MP71]
MPVTFDSTSDIGTQCESFETDIYEGFNASETVGDGFSSWHESPDTEPIENENGGDPLTAVCVTYDMLNAGLGELGRTPDGQSLVFSRLSIPNSSLTDIRELEPYHYIQNLDLSGNNLTDLSVLSCMKYLIKLNVSDNKLSEVLDFCPPPFNLQEIDFSRNQIREIRDLSEHRFLKSVHLDRNLIKEISGLDECRFLTTLSLSFNGIRRINNLDHLPIKYLDLTSNRLESMQGIETLYSLEELHLSHNSIQKLTSLNSSHKYLRKLDLDTNQIDDPEQITHLKSSLKMLTDLSVRKNPLVMPPAPVIPGVTIAESNDTTKNALMSSGSISSNTSASWKSEVQLRNENLSPTNPFSNNRLATAFQLQSLTVLDAKPLTVEEKVAAVNAFNPSPSIVASLQHSCLLKRQAKLYAKVKAEDLMRATHLRPIVLCGPSGAGKRTLTNRLLKDFPHIYGCSVSHTTRKPRIGEEQGTHYHFVTKKEMEAMIDEGKFAEVVTLFGYMYGTSMEAIDKVTEEGKVCIMDLEIEGVLALKRSHLKPLYVFITVPSLEVLKNRLENRLRPSTARKLWGHSSHFKIESSIPENSLLSSPEQSRPSSGIERPLSGLPPGLADFSRPVSGVPVSQPIDFRPLSSDSNKSNGDLDDDGLRRMILQKGDGNCSLLNLVTRGNQQQGILPSVATFASSKDMLDAEAPSSNASLMTEEQFQENVQKWMSKAPGVQSYADLKDFFDLKIMNDDPERAYAELRDFCLSTYIKYYNAND